ncbi:MAG: hypothetical protein ACE5JQ_04535 [Candidatus Methylomirabilales bacterium]
MKRQLLLLFLAMGLLLVGCATNFERRGTSDYAPRWVVYAIYPVGWFLDTALAGPINGIACSVPDVTGCTPHDELALKH